LINVHANENRNANENDLHLCAESIVENENHLQMQCYNITVEGCKGGIGVQVLYKRRLKII